MTESFSALLDESLSTLDMQPGSIVSGVVLDVDNDWVTVHVGLKSEGVVSLDEFRNNEGEVSIVVGDEVEVALEAVEDGYGETRISREKARKIATWRMLEDALESGEFVTGGKLVLPLAESSNENIVRTENGIQGGLVRKVKAGDVLVLQPGTPHWFRHIDDEDITYMESRIRISSHPIQFQ